MLGEGVGATRGAALFVLVDAEPRRRAQLDTAIQTVCDLGEVLRGGESPWRVARIVAGATAQEPLMAAVRREVAGLSGESIDVALVVLVGLIEGPAAEPALRGPRGIASLREVAAAVQACRAGRRLFAVAGWASDGELEPPLSEGCAAALSSFDAPDNSALVAVGLGSQAQPTLQGLFDALAGRALDPSTGTVTFASLASDISCAVPGVWLSGGIDSSSALFAPGGLVGAADLRLSRRPFPIAVGAPLPLLENNLVGTMLPGQFRVDALFARGGFGAIYRARQLRVDRDVAIKVLHAVVDPGSPSGRQFVQEVQSVARIDHPNVVRVYQADLTADGRLFFAMELLEGRDLEQVLREEGTLDQSRAIALICQMLAGLGAAHEAGLVHADIKPANALVVVKRGVERLVLVDFGLSRLRLGELPARSVGGTPAYMAPEQLRDGRVDARSDLFSAALVLVTLLTGWRRKSLEELVPPLGEIADAQLRAALGRALAIDPLERFQSATALVDALAREPEKRPRVDELLPTSEAPSVKSPIRWLRRGRLISGVGIALAIAGSWWWRQAGNEARLSPASLSGIAGSAQAPAQREILIGGSGTLLYGFFEPLRDFLEAKSGASVPIDSKFDLGSGGAMRSLRAEEIDVAALSVRFDRSAPAELLSAGKILLEVAIGFDETALFVRRDNPLRRLDIVDIRAHLCCAVGQPLTQPSWSQLGMPASPLAGQRVGWTLFGRTAPPVPRDSTSSTLLQADGWFCASRQLCAPASSTEEASADEVLAKLMTGPDVLALSTLAFANPQVVPLVIVDAARGMRLDGRKVLWLYLPVIEGMPVAPELCRLLDAVLDPSVAARLQAADKVQGLPERQRQQQRNSLGLDDGSCQVRPVMRPPEGAAKDGVIRASVGDSLEIQQRWVPDPPQP